MLKVHDSEPIWLGSGRPPRNSWCSRVTQGSAVISIGICEEVPVYHIRTEARSTRIPRVYRYWNASARRVGTLSVTGCRCLRLPRNGSRLPLLEGYALTRSLSGHSLVASSLPPEPFSRYLLDPTTTSRSLHRLCRCEDHRSRKWSIRKRRGLYDHGGQNTCKAVTRRSRPPGKRRRP